MERWGPYELEGLRNWDLAAYSGLLGGSNSRHILVPPGEPLEVRAECGAEVISGYESGGSWGTYHDLGGFIERHHPDTDWDGQPISSTSIGGDGGRSFEASYRICAGSCESFDVQPPILTLYHGMGQHMLLWYWEGDRSTIDGFKWYVNGNFISTFAPDRNSNSVRWFEPPCGGRREFHMTAYRGALESPPSNTTYWTGPDCPKQYRVTFERLLTGSNWGDNDEDRSEDLNRIGPIYGNFSVTAGDEVQSLEFDAAEADSFFFIPVSRGTILSLNKDYSIAVLFYQIRRDWTYGDSFSAPYTNVFTVELSPGDDLNFGGLIKDMDDWSSDDVIFHAYRPFPADDILTGEYTLSDRNITLVVLIEEISGQ